METARLLRFGPFELDVRAGELHKHGIRLRLQDQSFLILVMLTDRPGEVVLREDIRLRLWPNNTIVEFDHSINAAIKRLRQALGESAESPQYIETLAKRGYRFLGDVERVGEPAPVPLPPPDGNATSHYRLLEKLGEGGMGVVYRAEDLQLGRHVAIKFLPLSDDELPAMALRRFEREARAASGLNHPNICTVYGLENFNGKPAIVMELVEGETLAHRLERGRLQLAEALRTAIQIAGALAEAHRRGVVHRDLKPANVMLTRSGLKVLDFGLAKIEKPAASGEDETVTERGAILGTLHYMSPEQVQGKNADARSDIFSLGVMLYEILAGRRAFDGDSAARVMAGILERQPEKISGIPPALERALLRCLAKDAEQRWQSAEDLKSELEWIAEPPSGVQPPAPRSSWRLRLPWIAMAALAALSVVLSIALLRQKPVDAPRVEFPLFPPENAGFGTTPAFAVSPDGRRIAFTTLWKDSYRLWLRSLDSTAAVPVPGAEGFGIYLPFWSPDSKSIGLFVGDKLKRIDVGGPSPGPPVAIADAPAAQGGTWNRDGVIVFSPGSGPLYRIAAAGGSATPVTRVDVSKKEKWHASPWFLPDGRHFLFEAIHVPLPSEHVTIRAGSLDSLESKDILEADSNAIFVHGRLLFVRNNTLLAQPFDPRKLAASGDAVPVEEHIELIKGFMQLGFFSASEGGALVYRAGAGPPFEITWFDRSGTRLSAVDQIETFSSQCLELSPDRRSLAIALEENRNGDIWLYDVAQARRTRLTFDPAGETSPVWSGDGRTIAFASDRKGHYDIFRRTADQSGPEELIYSDGTEKYLTSWSPDGRFLLFNRRADLESRFEIWALPLTPDQPGSPLKPFPFHQTQTDERNGRFSPDGRWIVYDSSESGRQEVYLAPFDARGAFSGVKYQVSTIGGWNARWRKDGKEIFYASGRRLMAATVAIQDRAVKVGEEHQVIGPLSILGYDVSADGQRFLVVSRSPRAAGQSLTVVQNPAELFGK